MLDLSPGGMLCEVPGGGTGLQAQAVIEADLRLDEKAERIRTEIVRVIRIDGNERLATRFVGTTPATGRNIELYLAKLIGGMAVDE